ncbi:diguanylate cyclase [Rhodococcus sp. ARC_M12]|uniref:sensor domain-containing protein n=1 Tax=unclassified Rhodococcus (in: high G+C Gram-positive bacteria) TaxID=192944 RepID=UPI001FB467F2|nr:MULTISPECIES: diguanylate cyclase [unclassified Rhodococcus (in: high G+C Gram-positive bacteria)]MCJ0890952.1 diguanylate cyclase [Rhodococcus sp. ARC_M5]MCJ0979670.1 diguanylate cyclase [Rhodococcus sp. ARC_M12]
MAPGEREGVGDPESRSASPGLADRYRVLIEHSPDAIGVHRRGVLVYLNPAGMQYLRAEDAADVIGHPITEFIAAESVGPMLERIAALDAHGSASAASEATVLALDGTTLTMEAVSVRTVWNGEPAYQVILRDLTEHKAAQKALQKQAALVQHVSDAIVGVSPDGLVSTWNPAAESVYGRPAADVLGRHVSYAVGVPCDPAAILAVGGRQYESHRHADGSTLAVMVSAAQMPDGYVLVCADQSAVRRAEEHFTAVVESLEAGVVVLDHAGRIESANLAAKTILDIRVGVATAGQASVLPFRVYGTDEGPIHPLEHPVAITRKTGQPCQAVIGIERRRDGRNFWLSLTATMLNGGDPEPSIVATFVDVTETYRMSMQLEHAATHDDLTGLPNRPLILARLDEELARPAREDSIAVLFIDLDNFKTINDLHGHTVGDAVLGVVADRLTRALPAEAFVGRIGGDEFVAVVSRCVGTEADDLRAELTTPIETAGRVLTVTASIGGVTVDCGDTRSALDILDDADHEMYQAKPLGQYLVNP